MKLTECRNLKMKQELKAKKLIQSIAEEVRPAAGDARLKRVTYRLLGSFLPDHVITELIQNADDVGATQVKIVWTDKGVIFVHDGKDFDEADVRALCDIGITTKKPGVHIGFMGIGFKAVFKITHSPYVLSGPYRFYFTREEVFVPHWLDKTAEDLDGVAERGLTTFFLPFRPDLSREMLDSLKKSIFTKLEPVCMVFLKNIKEVSMVFEGNKCLLTKEREILRSTRLPTEKITITEKKEDKEKKYGYMVFKKTLGIPERAKSGYRAIESRRSELKTTDIVLVFDLADDDTLKPSVRSVLYTFLPTPFETGLRLTINGDFLLNTQRTDPDFTSQWNIWLFESIGGALKEIVAQFVRDEKQKKCFYDAMPRKNEVPEKLFSKIGIPLIDYMKNMSSMITSDGKLAKPSETCIVSERVQKIIPPARAGVSHYVDPSVKGKVFIREELGVKDLTEGSAERRYVLSALEDKEWMASLKTKQICDIYEFLYRKMYGDDEERWKIYYSDHKRIEEKLEALDIVRATNGSFYKAEETLLPNRSGKQMYTIDLPCLVFVDPATLSDNAVTFLKEIGARDFSRESIVAKILDSHRKESWRNWSEDEIKRSIKYIADWVKFKKYQVGQADPKPENVVLPIEGGGWTPAFNCYEPNPVLKEILPEASFVDLLRIKELVEEQEPFLEVVRVSKIPRVISKGSAKQWEEIEEISSARWSDYWAWLSREDHTKYSTRSETVSEIFHLDGFDNCVLKGDGKALLKYMDFLIENWGNYSKFTSCEYDYFYYYSYNKEVPSYFAYQLKTSNWVPTSKGLKHVEEAFAPFREMKKMGGKTIAYVSIPEEKATKNKEFLEFLGVKTKIDLETLLDIMEKLKGEALTDDIKRQLTLIYRRMAVLFEEENTESGTLEVFILNTKGHFQLSKDLYWIDESGIESVLGEEVPTAWIPDDLSTPRAESFFRVLGVTKLSSILERERIDDAQGVVEDAQLTSEFRRRADHLYSVLLHHKAHRVAEFPDFVKEAKAVKAKQLKLKLKALDLEREIKVPCLCSKEENRIYISSEIKAPDVNTEIARELARVFGAQPGSEFTLSFVLATQNMNTISEQLNRSSIRLVSLPEPEIEEAMERFEQLEGIFASEVKTEAVTETAVETPEKPSAVTTIEPPTSVSPTEGLPPKVDVHINGGEVEREVEAAKNLLIGGVSSKQNLADVWTESKEIKEVVSQSRVTVRPFVSTSSEKNWKPRVLQGEEVFVEVDIGSEIPQSVQTSLKSFRKRMRKIVEVMGGNPDTVNICVAKPESDGDRREGQLFFNAARNDSPLRWLVVAARELAYIKIPRPSYAHISLMTDLIEKALQRIDEIYPEFFKKIDAGK